jgi:hypothetical protein
MIGRWTLVMAVTVGIIAVTIPVVWYVKVWYEKRMKKPLLSIKVGKKSLNQGGEQTLTITTRNRKSNETIFGAIIKCGIFLSDEKKVQLEEGLTNREGKCSYKLKTDNWDPGKYNVKVGVLVDGYKDEYNTTKKFKVKLPR